MLFLTSVMVLLMQQMADQFLINHKKLNYSFQEPLYVFEFSKTNK